MNERPEAGTGFEELVVTTARGPIEMRLYAAPGAAAAVVLVGGVSGGFDSPARGLYERLGAELPTAGVAVLQVRYRDPLDLDEATHDVLAGVGEAAGRGHGRVGLVGHSFGGAAVVRAAVRRPDVTTLVTLSTQSYGTEAAPMLAPRSILLVHGMSDDVLPAACSIATWRRANEPKELRLIEGAGHVLDEAAEVVHAAVRDWLVRRLVS